MNENREAYTVAIGKFKMPPTKDQKKIMEMMDNFKGIIGIDPAFDVKWETKRGTVIFFETLNDAKEARNILRAEGVEVGTNILKVEMQIDVTGVTINGGERVA